jgi:hypothetical protein
MIGYDEHMDRPPSIDEAYEFLRGHTTADLRFDEHTRPIKYVISPGDGRLVAPVMVAMLQSADTVLFVPDFADEAMEIQVTLEPFEEHGSRGALADRWRIYHGEPHDVRWALLSIDAARYAGLVIDGRALMRPNPLAAAEGRICRDMNQDRDTLRRLCAHFSPTHMEIESPIMVGIDPSGFDVRARFDVVRVHSLREMRTDQEARAVLEEMKRQAGPGASLP